VLSRVPYVWSDANGAHDAAGEVWVGVRTEGTELPLRTERIREALRAAGAREEPARPHPDERLLAVHDGALLDHLRTAWQGWEDAGLTEDPGQDRVVPYLFPHPGLLDGLPARLPTAAAARAGRFAYDTMTLIGPGTWAGARAAADAALTAADLVLGGEATDATKDHIGYLPEERGLYPQMKVLDNLLFFGGLRGLRADAARRAAMTCFLMKLGLKKCSTLLG